jgi:hypothetical protein
VGYRRGRRLHLIRWRNEFRAMQRRWRGYTPRVVVLPGLIVWESPGRVPRATWRDVLAAQRARERSARLVDREERRRAALPPGRVFILSRGAAAYCDGI